TVTQADMDNGIIANTATAAGVDDDNDPVTSNPSSATVTAERGATLTLTKTADPNTTSQAGTTITYTFGVQNTGNVTVTGLTIDDPQLGGAGAPTCTDTTLA